MRKSTIVLIIVVVVLVLCAFAMVIGGGVADQHATETAQFATEWQRDIVEPIQTERAGR